VYQLWQSTTKLLTTAAHRQWKRINNDGVISYRPVCQHSAVAFTDIDDDCGLFDVCRQRPQPLFRTGDDNGVRS